MKTDIASECVLGWRRVINNRRLKMAFLRRHMS
jgi:hypothetical protein